MEKETFRGYDVFNIGTGTGNSVLEIIAAFERVTGAKLNYTIGPRRSGDVEQVLGDVTKAKEKLQWQTVLEIDEMMGSAWKWEKYLSNNPL
jgi:UDP-glucose 4-epimerase